ncbi:MAG: glycosyltransferase family 4 protein [Pseudomonadota bacterium]
MRGIPGVMGGVETHCEELLPRIAARDSDLAIEVLARRPYLPGQRRAWRGLDVTPLPAVRHSHFEAVGSTALGILYARWRGAQIVHVHAIGPALLVPLARALGLRVVMTHHGDDYNRAKWGRFAKFMLRTGERWGLARADRVIAVSPSLARRLARDYPAAKTRIRYIPNGAPALEADTESEAEILARLGLEPGGFILAVGRLVPEKGFDYLIDAHRRSGTHRKLVIVGDADHGSAFSRKLEELSGDTALLAGRQPRSVLKTLYAHTDLFVLPSFHEGLPIVALEAGFSGAPMLLSDIQPNLDIGLPERHYFPVGDVEALAKRLAESGSAFAIDSAALRRRFDWDEIADRTLAVYRAIME